LILAVVLSIAVVTSSTDLASLVEEVAGDAARIASLAPPSHDPHAVELKPSHLARLREADLLVRVGLDYEPWLTRALGALGDTRLRPGSPRDLDLSRSVELLQTETPRLGADRRAHVHGFGNPHYWLDPENARPMTAAIVDALGKLAPAERARFESQRARFLARLDAGLARWTRALAPYRGTRVVSMHDTWQYFARRFGLTVVAAVEPTPGVPPSAAEVGALIERMRESGVRVLLAEPYTSASLARRIETGTGAITVTLAPSVRAEPEARDYLALFDVDVGRLATALARIAAPHVTR
jgi:ABC-type Zn uptake system ZnuABC Zn-binding protein ZnuA